MLASSIRSALSWTILLMAGISHAAAAPDRLELFVDSRNGEDSSPGTSEAEPLQTLTAAQQKIDAAPEETRIILNLVRGSEWRESKERAEDDFREREQYFGRPGMVVRAVGSGDKPTLNGFDPLPNGDFQQPDPANLPNVWKQTVQPPQSFFTKYISDAIAARPGLMAGGRALRAIWPEDSPLSHMRDFARRFEGIETEEKVLAFLNEHPGFYYPRIHPDRSVDFFLNSGSAPPTDGLEYVFKARAPGFVSEDAVWEGFRIVGSNARHGPTGNPLRVSDVEFLFGGTHNMLLATGRFEDVLSDGYAVEVGDSVPLKILHPRTDQIVNLGPTSAGETYSVFHTHQGNAEAGLVYDRVTGRNAPMGFFDHKGDAHRPFVVIRDSFTENVGRIVAHRNDSTDKMFLLGHRHIGANGEPGGALGEGAVKENYIEDGIFPLGASTWNPTPLQAPLLRINNSAISVRNAPGILIAPGSDFEFSNSTLVIDLTDQGARRQEGGIIEFPESEENGGKAQLIFRNCVLAVVGDGDPSLRLLQNNASEQNLELRFENCVLVGIESIPAEAGKPGSDFVIASAQEVFSGLPQEGDFTLRPDGPAAERDAGFREGREPVIRPVADRLVEAMPRDHETPPDRIPSPNTEHDTGSHSDRIVRVLFFKLD